MFVVEFVCDCCVGDLVGVDVEFFGEVWICFECCLLVVGVVEGVGDV